MTNQTNQANPSLKQPQNQNPHTLLLIYYLVTLALAYE